MLGVSAATLAGYLAAIVVLMVTPGPDMMFVLANAARYGTRAGVVAALGVAAGEAVHVAAVVCGLAALVSASPVLFTAIRWAGAAYLIVLGVRALRGAGGPVDAVTEQGGRASRAFLRGLVTNLLNPKMILFSVAFLPQFVDPAAGDVTAQLVLLGALFVAVQLAVDIALGAGAGRLAGRLADGRWSRRINRICAVAFVALGIRLAAS
ncbi:Threonine/homoserine/homoserine lactone efflux protein [Micromonospora echinaurantiaca]|uniref:Threonine/homoserine/homoserine lactone efflux protein n=1 Tax=Micromonospora echinaurantiaca TaxID=47857 RepID=A0A1C5HHA3_9ACTN|nr:LysE family translocator [Micromonospora echinaurantiaca]SCG45365.1 Threonine/homoserine/homoserine lactone efflux protein [Micromonospora echinaurantiaca]